MATWHVDEEIVIAGAGPIGLACAISALRRGWDPLVIDAGAVVNSILSYPKQMRFFTTPERLEIGHHPFPCAGEKPTRDEALKYYRGIARTESLRVRTFTRLVDAQREENGILCRIAGDQGEEEVRCSKLVLAIGYFDAPNLLGIPGEDAPHVSHYYDEGHGSFQRDVIVIGGRNSAVEAVLDLFRCGARTTLVYRGSSFPRTVKYWLRPDIENRIRAGEITAYLEAQMLRIERHHVVIRDAGGVSRELPADRVYALTGYSADHELFRRIGIRLEGPRSAFRIPIG